MISNEGKARWARMALALAALMLGFAVLCCMPAQRAYADDATDGGTVVKHIKTETISLPSLRFRAPRTPRTGPSI